jgi:hypothetical protein
MTISARLPDLPAFTVCDIVLAEGGALPSTEQYAGRTDTILAMATCAAHGIRFTRSIPVATLFHFPYSDVA